MNDTIVALGEDYHPPKELLQQILSVYVYVHKDMDYEDICKNIEAVRSLGDGLDYDRCVFIVGCPPRFVEFLKDDYGVFTGSEIHSVEESFFKSFIKLKQEVLVG